MPRKRVTRESVPNRKPVADNADGFFCICALEIQGELLLNPVMP